VATDAVIMHSEKAMPRHSHQIISPYIVPSSQNWYHILLQNTEIWIYKAIISVVVYDREA
jgi:hypothetical protein